ISGSVRTVDIMTIPAGIRGVPPPPLILGRKWLGAPGSGQLSGTGREVLGPAKSSPTPPLRPNDGRQPAPAVRRRTLRLSRRHRSDVVTRQESPGAYGTVAGGRSRQPKRPAAAADTTSSSCHRSTARSDRNDRG